MRRVGLMSVVTAAALAVVTACAGGSKSTPLGAGRPAAASTAPSQPRATAGPSTTSPLPATSTTTVAPALPVPSPLVPVVTPALPGEGAWQPAGSRLPGGYAMYTTQVRPAAGLPETGVAWIDTKAARLVLYAGVGQPSGTWPQQSFVGPAQRPALMAAFNSGFKIYNYDTGWYDQGRTAVPLQDGAASLVNYSNGTATVGEWGRDVTMRPDVVAVRQNLSLLVDAGAVVPSAQYPSRWGAVLGGGVVTWRSAVGVTPAGDLIYAAGPDLTPGQLAELMVVAGAQRAMELDINPEWVSFATFAHSGTDAAVLTGTNLVPGMYYSPYHYLQPYTRDFFAVLAR